MKIGLNSRMLESRYPLPEALHKAAELGYDAYEIDIGIGTEPWVERRHKWQERIGGLRGASRAAGICLPSLCLSVLWQTSLASADPGEREEGIRVVHDGLELAAALGASALLLPIGQPEGLAVDRARANVVESVKRCLKRAEALGVVLALENVCQPVLYTAADLGEVVDAVGSEACGVYYDPGNQSFIGVDPVQEIRRLGQRIVRLHAKDTVAVPRLWLKAPKAKVTGDFSVWQRRTTVTLGEGELDYRQIVAALREIGYRDGVVLEVPQSPESAEAGCRANLRAAVQFFRGTGGLEKDSSSSSKY